MISGALEILHRVRAGLVHPLLLPGSQGPDMLGFIVITYEEQKEVFDILFVRGSLVVEYAGLHRGMRTLLSEDAVRVAIATCGLKCRVSLFCLTRQHFNSFLSTFHCIPSLDVTVDGLSRKQVSSLVEAIDCSNGILEVDRPSRPLPLITLFRFYSRDALLEEASRVKDGRLIIYDLELNAIVRQRAGPIAGALPVPNGDEAPAAGLQDTGDPVGQGDAASAPPSGDPPGHAASAAEVNHGMPPPAPSPIPVPESSEVERLVRAFRNAMILFEAKILANYGTSLDKEIGQIICRHFPPRTSFDPRMIDISNAALLLNVIEESAKGRWNDRRKLLRERALHIVRDLYEENDELLRVFGLEEKVQECYRHLEGK